jgi:hypothetical protein
LRDPVSLLNQRTWQGAAERRFENRAGYLRRLWMPWMCRLNRRPLEDHPETSLVSPSVLKSLESRFETGAYLSPYSDIAALMVFNHQMQMTTLLARMA